VCGKLFEESVRKNISWYCKISLTGQKKTENEVITPLKNDNPRKAEKSLLQLKLLRQKA
jgi:hypothetical protein